MTKSRALILLALLVVNPATVANPVFVLENGRLQVTVQSNCPAIYPHESAHIAKPSPAVLDAFLAVNGLDGAAALDALAVATARAASAGQPAAGDLLFARWLARSTVRKIEDKLAHQLLEDLAVRYDPDLPWVAAHIRIEASLIQARDDLRRSGRSPWVSQKILTTTRAIMAQLKVVDGPAYEFALAWERLGDVAMSQHESETAHPAYKRAWQLWKDAGHDPAERYGNPRMLCKGATFGGFAGMSSAEYKGPYRIRTTVGIDGRMMRTRLVHNPYTTRWARRAIRAAEYSRFRPAIRDGKPARFEEFEFSFDPIPLTD